MKFEAYDDTASKPRWRLWSGSNKVAASGQHFASTSNAERAAQTFKANAKLYTYTAFGSGTSWYWHGEAANGEKVATGGESFVSKANAEASYRNVRDDAGGATGP